MSKLLAALCAAICLSGCMSSGTQVSDEQIDQFVKGKTTEAEVTSKLGPPDMTQRSSNGERTDMYMYTKVAANAQSFIPLIGGFIASTDTKTKMVSFSFTRNGVLSDWSTSGGNSTINSGLLNQK